MSEEWRPIAGFPNYEISNLGRVRSFNGKGGTIMPEPHFIKPDLVHTAKNHDQRQTYIRFQLRLHGRNRGRMAHRLVLETFVGPCPTGMEARHINGNAQDCRLENLCWGTPDENAQDKKAHGTVLRGQKNPNAMLNESKVREIKRMGLDGVQPKNIAERFGCKVATIYDILRGRNWGYVDPFGASGGASVPGLLSCAFL